MDGWKLKVYSTRNKRAEETPDGARMGTSSTLSLLCVEPNGIDHTLDIFS